MDTNGDNIDIKAALIENAAVISTVIRDILAEFTEIPPKLKNAVEYMILGKGKKVRPAVVNWAAKAVSGQIPQEAKIAASAIEMVHTYSLIHDDLPDMDNDDFRRGKPSCHKTFDNATAILAGDALLTMAFEVLAKKIANPAMAVEMIKILTVAAGAEGMVAGQVQDLISENTVGSKGAVKQIHINKTAKMFAAAAEMGAVAAGASKEQKKLLYNYGIQLGLGFQIADDMLDVSATTEQLGKTAGKDIAQGKLTYPAIFGIEQAKKQSQIAALKADDCLKAFGQNANLLKELVFILLNRTK